MITTGSDNPVVNLKRFQWQAWRDDFRAAFCMRDPAQNALACLEQLQQGSKSIMDYCTAFFKLKEKLSSADVVSEYVKNSFWKGLSLAAMEALVNTDYEMVEQARDILLQHESKLADITAKRKGNWGGGSSGAPYALTTATSAMQAVVRSAPPPASADPNTMDIDCAQILPNAHKCFKCGKPEHLMALIRAAIMEALGTMSKAAEGKKRKEEGPVAGFV